MKGESFASQIWSLMDKNVFVISSENFVANQRRRESLKCCGMIWARIRV